MQVELRLRYMEISDFASVYINSVDVCAGFWLPQYARYGVARLDHRANIDEGRARKYNSIVLGKCERMHIWNSVSGNARDQLPLPQRGHSEDVDAVLWSKGKRVQHTDKADIVIGVVGLDWV